MALKTKASIKDIGEILARKASEFTFQDPALIDAPNTQISKLNGDARQLPDPSKTLRPALGVERIETKQLELVFNEVGPNGEPVYRIPTDDSERVRLVGIGWSTQGGTTATRLVNDAVSTTDFMEVTFYGTGLNILVFMDSNNRNMNATVDGGSEGGSIYPSTNGSNVIGAQGWAPNVVLPVVSGLSLGNHTVKIRMTGPSNQNIYGIEVLNEATQIQVPQGEIFSKGLKYRQAALEAIDYASGFDGSPTLNGRGGRVRMYKTPEGVTGKVIQQVESSAAYLSLTDHSNEEELYRRNFKSFSMGGVSNDWSGAAALRSFTLEDGTTMLGGNTAGDTTSSDGTPIINFSVADHVILTFVGSGLDVIASGSGASASGGEVFVDGISHGELTITNSLLKRYKICSGLPYGTHVVRILRNTEIVRPANFIVYGPKKPALPEGAEQIGEYFLMANFSAIAAIGRDRIAQGVLRKQVSRREAVYINGTGGSFSFSASGPLYDTGADSVGAFRVESDRQNAQFKLTFFGTGFDYRFFSDTNRSGSISVTLNGLAANTTNFPTLTAGAVGSGISFNTGTGIMDTQGSGSEEGASIRVENLPLDVYEVVFNNNTASQRITLDGFDIITPIHFPDLQVGSRSLDLPTQLSQESSIGGIDLGKAKAWIIMDFLNNRILDSYNIAQVVDKAAGQYQIYFERPFATRDYVWAGFSDLTSGPDTSDAGTQIRPESFEVLWRDNNASLTDPTRGALVFFGRLAEEEEE